MIPAQQQQQKINRQAYRLIKEIVRLRPKEGVAFHCKPSRKRIIMKDREDIWRGTIAGRRSQWDSYFFIIQLFYCPSANYTILTMFKSHLPSRNSINPSLHSKKPPRVPQGPFLIEATSHTARESKRASQEWPTDCHLRYLAFLQSCGVEDGQLRGRAAWMPFARMAKFIPSRNINQCRMHHKRLLREHLTPEGILTAHAPLIRQLAPSFRRYTQEATRLSQERIAETNKRSKLLKSVIIGQQQKSPTNPSPQAPEISKKGEDLIPTDVGYPEETGSIPVINQSNRRNPFPYYPFLQASIPTMPESHFSSGQPNQLVMSQSRQRDWQQCHQLFLAWTTKMHSLLS